MACVCVCVCVCVRACPMYRMAGNFCRNLFWRTAEISVLDGIYFGGLAKPVP